MRSSIVVNSSELSSPKVKHKYTDLRCQGQLLLSKFPAPFLMSNNYFEAVIPIVDGSMTKSFTVALLILYLSSLS